MNHTSPVFDAIARYRQYLSPEEYQLLLSSATEPAPSAVRMNLLKTDSPDNDLRRLSERYGWSGKSIRFNPVSMTIETAVTLPGQTLEHRMGMYYIQDAASILPVSLFKQSEALPLTLDMAASPGGKTTQLVDSTLDQGLIVANDASASRLTALKTVLSLWGAENVAITNFSGEKLGDWFPEMFDRVLLDAPCSMEGLRDSPSHPFRPITEVERDRLASRQVALLESALKAACIGGEIIYSTCTLAPEEDEMVINELLNRYPEAIEICKFSDFATPNGLTHFEGSQLLPGLKNALRIWPFTFGTNGFFAAKLTKTRSLPYQASAIPNRPFSLTGLVRLKPDETASICKDLFDLFNVDFATLFVRQGMDLYERKGQVFLIPQTWVRHFASLPYYSLGMLAGKRVKGVFEPSIDLINRWQNLIRVRNWQISDELISGWLRGGELRGSQFKGLPEQGIVIIRDHEDRYLGAGKVIPGRVRNLLPNRNLLQ